jgi:isocitrate lyase
MTTTTLAPRAQHPADTYTDLVRRLEQDLDRAARRQHALTVTEDDAS